MAMCYNQAAKDNERFYFWEHIMKSLGFGKTLIVLAMVAALVFAGTGCKKLTSQSQATLAEEVDTMSFSYIDNKFRDYTFGINEFMREHAAEATQKVTDGSTPGGVAAECTYTISPDGKYESLQMMKTLENGTQIDEYFNLGDSIFIASTTVYDDGNFEPVEKYYIIDGVIYKIDGSASTVTRVIGLDEEGAADMKASLDIYVSFDDIRSLYA